MCVLYEYACTHGSLGCEVTSLLCLLDCLKLIIARNRITAILTPKIFTLAMSKRSASSLDADDEPTSTTNTGEVEDTKNEVVSQSSTSTSVPPVAAIVCYSLTSHYLIPTRSSSSALSPPSSSSHI